MGKGKRERERWIETICHDSTLIYLQRHNKTLQFDGGLAGAASSLSPSTVSSW